MEMFLKRSYKSMFKFDVYFRNIEVIKLLNKKKSINSFGDMVSYTPQIKRKNNQKVSFNCAERCWMLYVVKLTTDSYKFWVAH